MALRLQSNAMRAGVRAERVMGMERDVLLVIDVQNSFVPGGTPRCAKRRGDRSADQRPGERGFKHVVLTQDWHPPGHISFASSHPGTKPFEVSDLPYGKQVLWPDHCVQGTDGANLHPELDIPHAQLVIRKGFHQDVDSYSAFLEADRKTPTGPAGYLREPALTRVFCAGLATDFCVTWSALDARKSSFYALVIEDACRAIDTQGSLAAAWKEMLAAGVERVRSEGLESV